MTYSIEYISDRLHDAVIEHIPPITDEDDRARTLFDLIATMREVVGGALTAVVDNERDEIMPSDPHWFSGESFDMTVTIGQYRRVVDTTLAAAAQMHLKLNRHRECWCLLKVATMHAIELATLVNSPGWARFRARSAVSNATDFASAALALGYHINGVDPDLELALQNAEHRAELEVNIRPVLHLSRAFNLIEAGNRAAMEWLRPGDLNPRHDGHTPDDDTEKVLWHATTELLIGASTLLQEAMDRLCPDDESWPGLDEGVRASVEYLAGQAAADAA